jgi:hypothetical protein
VYLPNSPFLLICFVKGDVEKFVDGLFVWAADLVHDTGVRFSTQEEYASDLNAALCVKTDRYKAIGCAIVHTCTTVEFFSSTTIELPPHTNVLAVQWVRDDVEVVVLLGVQDQGSATTVPNAILLTPGVLVGFARRGNDIVAYSRSKSNPFNLTALKLIKKRVLSNAKAEKLLRRLRTQDVFNKRDENNTGVFKHTSVHKALEAAVKPVYKNPHDILDDEGTETLRDVFLAKTLQSRGAQPALDKYELYTIMLECEGLGSGPITLLSGMDDKVMMFNIRYLRYVSRLCHYALLPTAVSEQQIRSMSPKSLRKIHICACYDYCHVEKSSLPKVVCYYPGCGCASHACCSIKSGLIGLPGSVACQRHMLTTNVALIDMTHASPVSGGKHPEIDASDSGNTTVPPDTGRVPLRTPAVAEKQRRQSVTKPPVNETGGVPPGEKNASVVSSKIGVRGDLSSSTRPTVKVRRKKPKVKLTEGRRTVEELRGLRRRRHPEPKPRRRKKKKETAGNCCIQHR